MRKLRIGIGAAVFVAAVVAGFAVARPLAPARLHAEVEGLLSELLEGPVKIGSLRVSLGWGLRLEGLDLTAWPIGDGYALTAARAVAEIRPFSHLTGQRRIRLIRLERPVLRVTRGRDGSYQPAPAQALLGQDGRGDDGAAAAAEASQPSELLRPIIASEALSRVALEKLIVADSFQIHGGRIEFADSSSGKLRQATVEDISGHLTHRTFFDETRLELRGRLEDASGARGLIEWDGRRKRDGTLRLAAATTDLEIEALAPWLLDARPEARLAARLSGALVLESPSSGHGRLEVDLIAKNLESAPQSDGHGPLEAQRVALQGGVSIAPEQVRVENLRYRADDLTLELDGTLMRPLFDESMADLTVAVREVTVRDLRHLIGWLPAVRREEAQALVASLERGHLRLLRAAGSATLNGWQAFLAGRSSQLPRNFVVDAHLEDTTVQVGEEDQLEDLSGRLWWAGDRVEVRGATASLNGSPLPQLDLSVDGVANLFASDPQAREIPAGAEPLVGLRTFWLSTHREPEGEPQLREVRLELDHLHHPMFFWPLQRVEADVATIEHGVRIAIERGRWAGVPVRGEVTWLFEPLELVTARFSAFPVPTTSPTPPPPASDAWAQGRFEVGAVDSDTWSQQRASGAFRATGGRIELADVAVDLAPSGRATASGSLDLSVPDAVPLEVDFAVEDGDVATLAGSVGLPRELATGRLRATGHLTTRLRSEASLADELTGHLDLDARDGTIQKAIPAVVVVALASAAVNPFAAKKAVHFDRFATRLDFNAGVLRTETLTLDGPDVRAFASGGVDVARPPHDLDVDVVLYLFRPVDFVLDKIPLLNLLLLGPNRNLIAAHYALRGPWGDPNATLVPHRSLTSGPGTMVFETVPSLVRRGLEVLDTLVTGDETTAVEPPPALPAAPGES